MKAAVITSSIGRPELRRCLQSVRAQTHPTKHYVFVNGQRFWASARAVLQDFPEVTAFYLPEETGDYGNGPSMADVFAAAPFLTRADWVFYLDDDNFYDADHVSSLLLLAMGTNLGWAYSLRRFVNPDGSVLCEDDWCSLGHLTPERMGPQIVDNSCFAVNRRLAQRMALAWTAVAFIADRCFFLALKESGERGGCTGLSTVNYRIGTGSAENSPEKYLKHAREAAAEYPGGFPWRKPAVF